MNPVNLEAEASMQLGDWDVRIVSGGTFRLDGGGMFGTVPKVLWDKLCPPDEDNTILLATNCLLIRGRGQIILVDAGNGSKESDAFMARFKLEGRGVLEANLAREGVKPEEVDLVVLTHLHFDHAGGVTRLDEEGRCVPTFPNARHVLQARDLDEHPVVALPRDRRLGPRRPDLGDECVAGGLKFPRIEAAARAKQTPSWPFRRAAPSA